MRRLTVSLLLLMAAGCIETREAPPRVPQGSIPYGPRIFLVDDTREGGFPNSAWCTRMVSIQTDTASTATITAMQVDSKGIVFDPRNNASDRGTPASCFIDVQPAELMVDQVEVTNELFQLCIDSGACSKPDPSKASKGPLCNDEDEFDKCPIVEVTQEQAATFCGWVGRRLPTGIEHIAIRQTSIGDRSDPAAITVYPTGDAAPASCEQAVVKVNGCLKPRPVDFGADSVNSGGAADDNVAGANGTLIYDLMGNVSEWSGDLHPVSRGPRGPDLPWFCIAPLSEEDFSDTNPPVCPDTAKCLWGQYAPYDGAAYKVWPVCIVDDNARFAGSRGALYGGSYNDDSVERDIVGTFSRRVENEPSELPDTQRARTYGFRCAGQRESAVEGGMALPFTDHMVVVDPPEKNQ